MCGPAWESQLWQQLNAQSQYQGTWGSHVSRQEHRAQPLRRSRRWLGARYHKVTESFSEFRGKAPVQQFDILGNQTFERYRLRVLTIPWWPSCTNSATRFWRTLAITMRFPRSAIFPSTEISLLRTLAKILRVLVSTVVDPCWGLWSRTVEDLQQGLVTNKVELSAT